MLSASTDNVLTERISQIKKDLTVEAAALSAEIDIVMGQIQLVISHGDKIQPAAHEILMAEFEATVRDIRRRTRAIGEDAKVVAKSGRCARRAPRA